MILRLNGVEVECVIGDLPEERVRTQRLTVDLALELADAVARDDRLESTVDYVKLSEAVRAALIESRCRMIERAAFIVARLAAGTDKVLRATARVTKYGSVPGMASATAEYTMTAEEAE